MVTVGETMARTALLLRMDALNGEPPDDDAIVDGLRNTTVRLKSDARNLSSPAGQTALVTLHNQLIMTGFRVDLDISDHPLLVQQPPLRGGTLSSALADYSADLMPGGSRPDGSQPVLTIVLGDTNVPADLRLSGGPDRFRLAPDTPREVSTWTGDQPFGAIAGAAAATVDAVRAAMPNIQARLDRPTTIPLAWTLQTARVIDLALPPLPHPLRQTLSVDFVSGGAITQACVYTLVRSPGVTVHGRVFEPEALDHSNLNRYSLSRASQVGLLKADLLASLTPSMHLEPVTHRYERDTSARLRPGLAGRVAIGVDHIPTRWVVAADAAARVIDIGATSHDFVLTSTHAPGAACPGCTHPKDDPHEGPIPTIGFVTLWAGLLQARSLLAQPTPGARATLTWPLGLDGQHGIQTYEQARVQACPVQCAGFARDRA